MTEYVLGGGCFWCLDAAYRQFRGVIDVISGYSGGHSKSPSYEQVCSGSTGHAEVVRVVFDESVISPDVILDIFFTIHDPRQLNRQGNDIGTQYRSCMFYRDESERAQFEAALVRAAELWGEGIVTEVLPLAEFWPAEPYHQDYFAKNPNQGYCVAVVSVKAAKARSAFGPYLKG